MNGVRETPDRLWDFDSSTVCDRLEDGSWSEPRPFSPEEAGMVAAQDALVALAAERELQERALEAHRTALLDARTLLLDYGTPQGLSFTETYSAVQTAALDYRDSGIEDKECEDHLQWITARTGQITAAALFQAGILQ